MWNTMYTDHTVDFKVPSMLTAPDQNTPEMKQD